MAVDVKTEASSRISARGSFQLPAGTLFGPADVGDRPRAFSPSDGPVE